MGGILSSFGMGLNLFDKVLLRYTISQAPFRVIGIMQWTKQTNNFNILSLQLSVIKHIQHKNKIYFINGIENFGGK